MNRPEVSEEQRLAAIFVAGQIVGLALNLPVEAFVDASISDGLNLAYARQIGLVAELRRKLELER